MFACTFEMGFTFPTSVVTEGAEAAFPLRCGALRLRRPRNAFANAAVAFIRTFVVIVGPGFKWHRQLSLDFIRAMTRFLKATHRVFVGPGISRGGLRRARIVVVMPTPRSPMKMTAITRTDSTHLFVF